MEKLKNFEIPNKKIEAWKFTDLKKVFEKNSFEPVKQIKTKKSPNISSAISKNIFFNPKTNFIIFKNGYVEKMNIESSGLEIKFLNKNNKNKTFNQKNFNRNDSLLDINKTFSNDNLIINVKKNIKLSKSISIFYYNSEKKKYLINNRIHITLEENAHAEINEVFFSNKEAVYWNNIHNYICLKKN